jgi:hypothetical protein
MHRDVGHFISKKNTVTFFPKALQMEDKKDFVRFFIRENLFVNSIT